MAERVAKLSVIIPVFNEEATLETLLQRVRAAVTDIDGISSYEIIAVDDMSSDSSPDILRRQAAMYRDILVLLKHVNRGKGKAIQEALKYATGDIILIQDADLEYDPADYAVLVRPVLKGEAAVVYGSRFLTAKPRMRPLSRLANMALTALTNLLYGARLSDMETCYKVFRADVVRSIPLHAHRFDFEPEITAKILRRGLNILEVPISYNSRDKDEGKKIGWRDGLLAIFALIRYRFTSNGESAAEVEILWQRVQEASLRTEGSEGRR
jgi:glycosyltransferase involved in cell wall biosynthesis